MSIGKLFWWIYQLSPTMLLLLFALCTLVFFLLLGSLERQRRSFLAALLLLWTAAVLWTTILNRTPGMTGVFQTIPFHSYREMQETGNREILRSNFMNAALFYPGGLLLAALLPSRWRFLATGILLMVFSASIEHLQHHLALGRGEIDDVIHNTLGGCLGCLAFYWNRFFPSKIKRLEIMIDEKNHAGFWHPAGSDQNVSPGQ